MPGWWYVCFCLCMYVRRCRSGYLHKVVTDGLHPMVIGTSRGRKFTERDAFIGYQKDTPAAVVFQATHQLRGEGPVVSSQESGRMEQVSIPAPKAKEEEEVEENSHMWKENVSSLIVLLTCIYETWKCRAAIFGQNWHSCFSNFKDICKMISKKVQV